MVSPDLSSRRRQYRFQGPPGTQQRVVRLALQLASAQRRLDRSSGVIGNRSRHSATMGSRDRHQRQQRRLLLALIEPFPGEWRRNGLGERFWWSLRWFGAGVLTGLAASRL